MLSEGSRTEDGPISDRAVISDAYGFLTKWHVLWTQHG